MVSAPAPGAGARARAAARGRASRTGGRAGSAAKGSARPSASGPLGEGEEAEARGRGAREALRPLTTSSHLSVRWYDVDARRGLEAREEARVRRDARAGAPQRPPSRRRGAPRRRPSPSSPGGGTSPAKPGPFHHAGSARGAFPAVATTRPPRSSVHASSGWRARAGPRRSGRAAAAAASAAGRSSSADRAVVSITSPSRSISPVTRREAASPSIRTAARTKKQLSRTTGTRAMNR